MRPSPLACLAAFVAFCSPVLAGAEAGRLPVQSFTGADFGQMSRTSGIAIDREGMLYAGGDEAVLSYDGQTWRTLSTPGSNLVLSLSVDPQDRIWVVGVADFGRLVRTPQGGRVFESMKKRLPAGSPEVGFLLEVESFTHGTYFISDTSIVRCADDTVSVIKGWRAVPSTDPRVIYAVNSAGVLHSFDGSRWTAIIDTPILNKARITGIVHASDNTWFVLTSSDGLWKVSAGGLSRFPTPLDPVLKGGGAHRIDQLADGTIAVEPWGGGLALIDPANGNLLDYLTTDASGAPLPRSRGLAQDSEGNLWIAHASGIACVRWPAHYSTFDTANGLPRAAIKRILRFEGKLYAATSQGLFGLEPAGSAGRSPSSSRFVPVPGCEDQVWSCAPLGDRLVLGGPGLSVVRPGQPPVRLPPIGFVDAIVVPHGRTDAALIIVNKNLFALHRGAPKDPTPWTVTALPTELPATPFQAVQDPEGALWVSIPGAGVYRLPDIAGLIDGHRPAPIEHFADDHGFKAGSAKGRVVFADEPHNLWLASNDTIYRFDSPQGSVTPVLVLPQGDDSRPPEVSEAGGAVEGLWGEAREYPAPGKPWGRQFVWHPQSGLGLIPTAIFTATGLAQAFLEEPAPGGSVAWIGGDDGIVRAEFPAVLVHSSPFRARIRRIADGQGNELPLPSAAVVRFSAGKGTFSVEFSTDRLADRGDLFQTELVGRDTEWQTPTKSAVFSAANLPAGAYELRTRALDTDGSVSAPVAFALIVAPFWWQTRWALAAQILAGIGLVLAFVRWRLRSARIRNLELEALIASRTQELSVAKVAAESASNAKSTFLANMSHELRTPLNAIMGYAQILRRDSGLTANGRRQLDIVGRNGEHLLQMINEVLDLAKIEAGKMTLQSGEFPLARVVKTAADLFEQRATEKGLSFSFEMGAGLPRQVVSDEGKIRQILFNLLSNAVKFTQSGEVVLSAKRTGTGAVRFEVRDTGPGIPQEAMAALFTPFHQADPASQGTGLGLAISQRLAGILGSRIEATSTAERGSRFWFELQLTERTAEPHEPAAAPVAVGYRGARRRILIADDEETNRLVLRDMLEPLGFATEGVADGQSCLAKVTESTPDLVLLDLRMPVLGGLEVIPQLRSIAGNKRMPIIVVSASVFEFNSKQAIAAGCDGFLPKPVDESLLLKTLGDVLEIEWIVTGGEKAPEPEPSVEAGLPPSEEIDLLLDLAHRGDLAALRDRIGAALARASAGRSFLRRIDRLASEFKTTELRRQLEAAHTDARAGGDAR